MDLPVITEPDTDDTNDANGYFEQVVEREVEKLLMFKYRNVERRETISCEKDARKIILIQFGQLTSRSLDS